MGKPLPRKKEGERTRGKEREAVSPLSPLKKPQKTPHGDTMYLQTRGKKGVENLRKKP